MSEIKVNKISPRTACGTTTLGDSGDTISIPAGVTISNAGTAAGFGSTGEVSWNTTKITADPSTAATGVGYFTDTSGGAFNVTLPASPSAGNVVAVADYANTWDSNNLTIVRNGSNIEGAAENYVANLEGASLTFVFVDATKGWIVTNSGNSTAGRQEPSFIVATGGNTVTTDGDFKVHAFTSPGTFCVSSAGNASGSTTVEALIVAGGGGGGGDRGSGAGGGGLVLTPCAGVSITASSFPIAIGGGGSPGPGPASGNARDGAQGTNTTGLSLTAIGGGFGRGGGGGVGPLANGGPGGSGGGGSDGCAATPRLGVGGPGTQPSQSGNSGTFGFGNTGGNAANPGGFTGGGGGAGAVGGNASNPPGVSGTGGAGKPVTSIFGSAPKAFYGPSNGFYAGGGGGGSAGGAPAGGGNRSPVCNTGGNGGDSPNRPGNPAGDSGATNTGGGGGGGSNISNQGNGGSGGSGIVLIRYKFQ